MTDRRLFAERALLPDGWAADVLLSWNADGRLTSVTRDQAAPAGAPRATGPVLPGMPNLHSHAFQRAFGGLTEFRGASDDSFWSWRALMYRFAERVTPEQLEAIATWLFVEMLEGGYASVCEFHYLHHDRDGTPYDDDATLARCVLRAASAAGIRMTLLPVLYQTSGFGGAPPSGAQRRFARSTDSMLRLLETLAPACAAEGGRVGLALHSLRAVPPDSLRDALTGFDSMDAIGATAPIHIHIAEQTREVDDCVAWSGQRPVEWLLDHANVNDRWCLVHATHLTTEESVRAARTGAVAGLCPTTEANLGDGVFAWPAWQSERGRWGVGSDSHVCVNAAEELLTLEYSQRLTERARNLTAEGPDAHTATSLYHGAVAGGSQAAGHRDGAGLTTGSPADFVVLDARSPLVADLPPESMLGAHVFASHRRSAIDEVWVSGVRRVDAGRHPLRDAASSAFVRARRALLDAT